MMSIIIGAIVSMLIFFFQQWWTGHHPTPPTAEMKTQFLDEVGRWHNFWMGPKRKEYAATVYEKFAANYHDDPPVVDLSDAPLTKEQARKLAQDYSEGI